MKNTVLIAFLTLAILIALDLSVAVGLNWADDRGKLGSLVRYFEYGRSVPGKLAKWEAEPDANDNLYEFAWRSGQIAYSTGQFQSEQPDIGPVVRSYGMSFVNNIINAAQTADSELSIDIHSGPAAPPNYTYAVFQDDGENRNTGDIAVLGILSSSVPAMAALSNSTWAFEQPAPFTYPIYRPNGGALQRIEPLINSADDQRALRSDPVAKAAWDAQLASHDLFHSPKTFGAQALDVSPFARLVRRSMAISHVEDTKNDIITGGAYPFDVVLRQMATEFAAQARDDGQIPIVLMVQSRELGDADLLSLMQPALDANDIPYFATATHFDPSDPSGFLADGHYKPEIDGQFGEAFAELVQQLTKAK